MHAGTGAHLCVIFLVAAFGTGFARECAPGAICSGAQLVAALQDDGVGWVQLGGSIRLAGSDWPQGASIVRRRNFTVQGSGASTVILDLSAANFTARLTLAPGVVLALQHLELRNSGSDAGFGLRLLTASPGARLELRNVAVFAFVCLPFEFLLPVIRGYRVWLPAAAMIDTQQRVQSGGRWCRTAPPGAESCYGPTLSLVHSVLPPDANTRSEAYDNDGDELAGVVYDSYTIVSYNSTLVCHERTSVACGWREGYRACLLSRWEQLSELSDDMWQRMEAAAAAGVTGGLAQYDNNGSGAGSGGGGGGGGLGAGQLAGAVVGGVFGATLLLAVGGMGAAVARRRTHHHHHHHQQQQQQQQLPVQQVQGQGQVQGQVQGEVQGEVEEEARGQALAGPPPPPGLQPSPPTPTHHPHPHSHPQRPTASHPGRELRCGACGQGGRGQGQGLGQGLGQERQPHRLDVITGDIWMDPLRQRRWLGDGGAVDGGEVAAGAADGDGGSTDDGDPPTGGATGSEIWFRSGEQRQPAVTGVWYSAAAGCALPGTGSTQVQRTSAQVSAEPQPSDCARGRSFAAARPPALPPSRGQRPTYAEEVRGLSCGAELRQAGQSA